jgi:hypothetical protein
MDIESGIGLLLDDGAVQANPFPLKRRRNLDDATHRPRPPSPMSSKSTASLPSHKRGRLSPMKQIQTLKEVGHPVIFCGFESLDAVSKVSAIVQMAWTLKAGAGGAEDEMEHRCPASAAQACAADASAMRHSLAALCVSPRTFFC